MNGIQIFNNPEFGSIRTLEIDGKPYFVGKDIADMLGYSNSRRALKDHCRWVTFRYVPHPQNPEKEIGMSFIPESDIYRLIVRSKLPAAEKFERWVFDEVLPSIRKSGGYIAGPRTDDRQCQKIIYSIFTVKIRILKLITILSSINDQKTEAFLS